MFEHITLHGGTASLLWGYRTAAVLRSWRISRDKGTWTLTATVDRVDAFQCRQKPLLFTAPRDKGFWCWPVVGEIRVETSQVVATLGPPEQ